MQSLIYLRLDQQAPTSYTIPLLEAMKQQLPELTVFEFDNFSDAHIRQYGADLAKQSQRLAVVVAVAHPDAPIAGLTTFFNHMLKNKPESLLLVLQGEQPVLEKMMITLAKATAGPNLYRDLSKEALNDLLQQFFS